MITLRPLEDRDRDLLEQSFRIEPAATDGYLAEELFGWSRSRLIEWRGELAGLIQVRKIDLEKGAAVMGTWLLPHARGRGVNQAAKMAMLQELFAEFPELREVYLSIEQENVRSIKAAEKLPYARKVGEESVPTELLNENSARSATGQIWFVIERGEGIKR